VLEVVKWYVDENGRANVSMQWKKLYALFVAIMSGTISPSQHSNSKTFLTSSQ
jgi:hypothetical protein